MLVFSGRGLPKSLGVDSVVHDGFCVWVRTGVFEWLWGSGFCGLTSIKACAGFIGFLMVQ